MTHFSLPRIHFKGTFKANPPTGNNDDIVAILASDSPTILNPKNKTDAQLRQWLMQATPTGGGHVQINAGWNYFGDCSAAFEKTTITSARLQSGKLLDSSSKDSLIGANVAILGNQFGDFGFATMADVDAIGAYSTQLFAGKFQLTGQNGNALLSGWSSTSYSRWVTRWRNLWFTLAPTSCIWQFVLPNGDWEINDPNSQPLTQLAAAAHKSKGILVRFTTYTLFPSILNTTMAKDFAAGNYVTNPARGGLVGTIGVWEGTEPRSLPIARLMKSQGVFTIQMNGKNNQHVTPIYKGKPVIANTKDTPKNDVTFPFGPALVSVDEVRKVVTLDLLATFPECDRTNDKVDFGTVDLYLKSQTGASAKIGSLAYGKSSYDQSGGMVELAWPTDLQAHDFQDGTFEIVCEQLPGSCILAETDDFVIVTDERGLYAVEGDTVIVNLAVYSQGELISEGVDLTLNQYQDKLLPDDSTADKKPFPNKDYVLLKKGGRLLTMPDKIHVPAGGKYCLTLTAVSPGNAMIYFHPTNTPTPSVDNLDMMLGGYSNIRIFPDDNFDHVPDSDLTWKFIYQQIFRYFYLLYPAMSIQGFPLNDKKAITARAAIIKTMVDERLSESSIAMPITRDLTPGKRELLRRWCSLHE